MIKEVNRICPVCKYERKAKVLKTIHLGNQEFSRLPSSYDVVCCENCGFCYADTTATMEDYYDYYENCNIYSGSPNKLSEKECGFDIAKDVMEEFLSNDSKLLDIGCGSGEFEIKARKSGYKNIIAIDPSIESIQKLKDKNFFAMLGNVYDEPCDELKGKVDAVFLLAVLEHLLEPEKAIKQIIKYLKPMGKLFIWVPDYGKINRNLTQEPNNFNCEHINYFSIKSLNNLLNLCGFKEIFNKTNISADNSFKEYQLFSVYTYINEEILIEKDKVTEAAITQYFERESRNNNIRLNKINEIRRKNEEIIIWGTGAFTMSLLESTTLSECNIIAYVDNNSLKIGKTFRDKKIISPMELSKMNGTIVIVSMLYAEDIKAQIVDMKLMNEIMVLE